MASTWGNNKWGANSWASDVVSASVTGQAINSGIGTLSAFNATGWGRAQWGNEA